jgi:hypothetical protein
LKPDNGKVAPVSSGAKASFAQRGLLVACWSESATFGQYGEWEVTFDPLEQSRNVFLDPIVLRIVSSRNAGLLSIESTASANKCKGSTNP